jgi:phage recombination protein Bet
MENAVVSVNEKLLTDYLQAFGLATELSEKETMQFLQIAKAYSLNPFKREIYCIAYGQGEKRKLSIITGYEVYLKRAERPGALRGWKAWTEGTVQRKSIVKEIPTKNGGTWKKTITIATGDLRAIVEIHREGWKEPFRHEVFLDEYAQENEMWGSKPRTMLKKVAVAQGFRMCFPDELGGMPYTSDEMPAGSEIAKHAGEQETTLPDDEAEARTAPDQNEAEDKEAIVNLAKQLNLTEDERRTYWTEYRKDLKAIRKALQKELEVRTRESGSFDEDPDEATSSESLEDLIALEDKETTK